MQNIAHLEFLSIQYSTVISGGSVMGNFEDIFVVKSRGSVDNWSDPHGDLDA